MISILLLYFAFLKYDFRNTEIIVVINVSLRASSLLQK